MTFLGMFLFYVFKTGFGVLQTDLTIMNFKPPLLNRKALTIIGLRLLNVYGQDYLGGSYLCFGCNCRNSFSVVSYGKPWETPCQQNFQAFLKLFVLERVDDRIGTAVHLH